MHLLFLKSHARPRIQSPEEKEEGEGGRGGPKWGRRECACMHLENIYFWLYCCHSNNYISIKNMVFSLIALSWKITQNFYKRINKYIMVLLRSMIYTAIKSSDLQNR